MSFDVQADSIHKLLKGGSVTEEPLGPSMKRKSFFMSMAVALCCMGFYSPVSLAEGWVPTPVLDDESRNLKQFSDGNEHEGYYFFIEDSQKTGSVPEYWIENGTKYKIKGIGPTENESNIKNFEQFKGIRNGSVHFLQWSRPVNGGGVLLGGEKADGESSLINEGITAFHSVEVGNKGKVDNKGTFTVHQTLTLQNGGSLVNNGRLLLQSALEGGKGGLVQIGGVLTGSVESLFINLTNRKEVDLKPEIDYRGGTIQYVGNLSTDLVDALKGKRKNVLLTEAVDLSKKPGLLIKENNNAFRLHVGDFEGKTVLVPGLVPDNADTSYVTLDRGFSADSLVFPDSEKVTVWLPETFDVSEKSKEELKLKNVEPSDLANVSFIVPEGSKLTLKSEKAHFEVGDIKVVGEVEFSEKSECSMWRLNTDYQNGALGKVKVGKGVRLHLHSLQGTDEITNEGEIFVNHEITALGKLNSGFWALPSSNVLGRMTIARGAHVVVSNPADHERYASLSFDDLFVDAQKQEFSLLYGSHFDSRVELGLSKDRVLNINMDYLYAPPANGEDPSSTEIFLLNKDGCVVLQPGSKIVFWNVRGEGVMTLAKRVPEDYGHVSLKSVGSTSEHEPVVSPDSSFEPKEGDVSWADGVVLEAGDYDVEALPYSPNNGWQLEFLENTDGMFLPILGGVSETTRGAGSMALESVYGHFTRPEAKSTDLWVDVLASHAAGRSNSWSVNGRMMGLSSRRHGLVVGLDRPVDAETRLGAAAFGLRETVEGRGWSNVRNKASTWGASIYLDHGLEEGFSMGAQVVYLHTDNKLERVRSSGARQKASPSTNAFIGSVRLRHASEAGGLVLTPHAGLDLVHARTGSFGTTDGGALKYRTQSSSTTTFELPLGLSASTQLQRSGWTIEPSADVTVTTVLGGRTVSYDVSRLDGTTRGVEAVPVGRFILRAGLGVRASHESGWDAAAFYDALRTKNGLENRFRVEVRRSF